MKEIIPIACDHAGYELKLKVIEHLRERGFEVAHLGRQHNDCNCISMPARFISEETALQIVDEYLNTPFEGGRHERRVEKISQVIN